MPNSRRFVLLPVVLLFLLACTLTTPQPTAAPTTLPTARPTRAPNPSPTEYFAGPTTIAESAVPPTGPASETAAATQPAAATATPPSIATRSATRATDLKLSAGGPWLLFSAADGLWAANADGTGLTQVMPAQPFFRLGPAAPSGGTATVLTGSDATGFHGLTLWLLSLPSGALKKISALTDASTEPGPDAQFGDPLIDVITPLGQADWSPDGASVAFIGAQAGPSADLFRYDVATGKVTRLTDGASQAYGPSWSPDGRFVVQFGATTFGTGAGYTMEGVWAAAADNSGVKTLYKPDSGGEQLLGWPGPETFAVTSFYVQCSSGQARTYNIATGKTQPIFPGYYSQLAADPATGTALVAVDKFVAECAAGSKQGLFLARPGAAPKLLDADAGGATDLGWSAEAGVFYALSDAGWLAFTPDARPAHLPEGLNGIPVVAPGGKTWAWVNPSAGLQVGELGGGGPVLVSPDQAVHPTWSPDGQTLLFFAGDYLYAARGDNSSPQPVGKVMSLVDDSVTWVKR